MGQNCGAEQTWPLSGNSLCHQSCQRWGHEQMALVWVLSFIFPSEHTCSWIWSSPWGEGERRHMLFLSKPITRELHIWGQVGESWGPLSIKSIEKKGYYYLFYSADSVLNKIQSYLIAEFETQRDYIWEKNSSGIAKYYARCALLWLINIQLSPKVELIF